MSYSGNPSLPSDAKQRILSTFDQTLDLAREGSRQEALLGCDFVLRMDPQFQPAQVLQERLRANAGPVQVDDLRGAGAPSPQTTQAVLDPFADLNADGLDLPDALPDSAAYLRDELQTLFDQRRFQDLMATAERERTAVVGDLELQRIVGAAQELMESEPYVLKFLNGAKQALQAHHADEAARLLEKARALDPGHPGLAALARALGTAGTAPPPAAAFGGAGGGDSESDRRIQQLLDEGQRAFDARDPQGAIDAWSRIFLIDIDHQEASRRIEMARRLKAESERQVEEIFHDGLARLEAGDPAGARQAFQQVLDIQPGYFAAREYLQQLDAGIVPTPKPTGTREMPAAPAVLPLPSDLEVSGEELKEEILVPPEPGEQPAPARERRAPKRTAAVREGGRARRLFFLVGGAVLVIALVGGWFAWQNREQLFPNSQETTQVPALSQDPIARAQRLHKAGRTAIALNQLRRIGPSDPHYNQAQKLIAEWGGAAAPEAPPPAVPGTEATTAAQGTVATPELTEDEQRRQALLAAARQAYSERAYLQALRRLQRAGAIAKLDGNDAKLLADTQQQLAPLARQIELFQQKEWEYILRDLWIMHENDPSNRDVTQLLVDCNYNLAVRDLQRNDTAKAADKLADAVKLQPADETLRRHYLFAKTYQERPKDLLYRIYVRYLPDR